MQVLAQVLIVGVYDATAHADDATGLWYPRKNVPGLTPERMEWYRAKYIPNVEDRADWRASPLHAPEDTIKRVRETKTFITGAGETLPWAAFHSR